MEEHWDVIIVGARCAGATLATLLARRGLRILLLEASSRGSNMPMSTHLVQAPGMDVLDRLGVGPRVRACTPATARLRLALDSSELINQAHPGREAFCIRRATLDPWLQDGAEAAGADLRCRHRVTALVRQAERVTGVVAQTPHGSRTYYADLVIGADGMHSKLAELTRVESYHVSENARSGYFAYYPAPARWEHSWDATLEHTGDELRYVFRTDAEQLVLVYMGARAEISAWGQERADKLRAAFARSPTTRRLSEGKQPIGASIGLLKCTYYYRRPVGPGFALIGDAGHFKDFATGQGMTDALLDAERMASAVMDGREAAFLHYWRERDVATMPLHFDAIRQGTVGYNEPFVRCVISHMARDPKLAARLPDVLDRKLEPAQLMPTRTLLFMLGAALVRGRFDVLRGFLQSGRALGREGKELMQRKALLAEVRAQLEQLPRAQSSAAQREHAA
jgi:menaquinone-9 beta-reductase